MLIYGLLFLMIGPISAFIFQRDHSCPKPHNFSDEIYISFEKFIVPKIEVLLNQNISKIYIGTNSYFSTLPSTCNIDALSKARTNIILGRINYLSEIIANSRRFHRALGNRRINFISPESERIMRDGIIQAGEVELGRG